MPQVIIYDAKTSKSTARDFNSAELAQLELDKAEAEAQAVAQAEAAEAKAVARQAVLDRLGLTEQEAQLLLGS